MRQSRAYHACILLCSIWCMMACNAWQYEIEPCDPLTLKIGAKTLREGITELEVVAEIEYQLKKRGVAEMSFTTMVLFGENAASPHGVPGDTKLRKNQFVLFDLGTMHEGYASDVTRTLFFGEEPSAHQQKIYDLVLAAHDEAMASVQHPASKPAN